MNYGLLTTAGGPIHWLVLDEPLSQPIDSNYIPDFLNEAELDVFKPLKTEKRRRDWLMGRLAGKLLIAELARGKTGHTLSLNQITILPHNDGWPILSMPPLPGLPAVTLSISHSRDRAFCAAVEGENRPIGADTEHNEPRSDGFADEYFTPLEMQFLSAAPPEQHDWLINAIWSGKEAALKAIRRGLTEDTRIVSCLPHPVMGESTKWLPMRIVWAEDRVTETMPPLSGLWRYDGAYVMTLAFAAEAP